MTQPVCKGDPTSHGGFVKTASSTWEIDGRMMALHLDIVTCPWHGDNPIMEHGEGYDEDGRKRITDGCKSLCGSIVRATTKSMDIE